MNDILYTAAYVLPITGTPIDNGAVHVRDGRILAVGTIDSLQRTAAQVEIIDFGQAILMPPLVNAHTHLELTDFKLWLAAADEPVTPSDFAEWILQVIRVKRNIQHDDFVLSLNNGLRQSLACGTGVIVDILSKPELAEVYLDSPLLGRIDCELIGRVQDAMSALLERSEQWLHGRSQSGKGVGLDRGLSPHAPYTVASDILTEIVALAETRHAALSIHTAESLAELELLQQSRGALAEKLYPAVGWQVPEPPLQINPATYLDQAGALRCSTLLVHALHLSPDEIGRIGRCGSSVVLCPRCNEQLGNGTAPVEQFLCRGINLALGTDSLASNDSLSVWAEMAAALRIYTEHLSPVQIIAMATINGAIALGLQDEIGALKPGAGVHFQVLRPAELPAPADLAEFLCQEERQQDIAHLYLKGVDVLPAL